LTKLCNIIYLAPGKVHQGGTEQSTK